MTKFLITAFLFPLLCSADSVVYPIDETVGGGGVTGYVETDGTIGALSTGNVLDWDLLLNDGTSTFELLGPLSGNTNSAFSVIGSALTATQGQLFFDFDSSDPGTAIFQSPFVGSGQDYWCLQTGSDCGLQTAAQSLELDPTAAIQMTNFSGNQPISGPSSMVVPEPAVTASLLLGLLICALWTAAPGVRKSIIRARNPERHFLNRNTEQSLESHAF